MPLFSGQDEERPRADDSGRDGPGVGGKWARGRSRSTDVEVSSRSTVVVQRCRQPRRWSPRGSPFVNSSNSTNSTNNNNNDDDDDDRDQGNGSTTANVGSCHSSRSQGQAEVTVLRRAERLQGCRACVRLWRRGDPPWWRRCPVAVGGLVVWCAAARAAAPHVPARGDQRQRRVPVEPASERANRPCYVPLQSCDCGGSGRGQL